MKLCLKKSSLISDTNELIFVSVLSVFKYNEIKASSITPGNGWL